MESDDIRFQQNVKESKKEKQLANKDPEESSWSTNKDQYAILS